jgi:hypothetical protein
MALQLVFFVCLASPGILSHAVNVNRNNDAAEKYQPAQKNKSVKNKRGF